MFAQITVVTMVIDAPDRTAAVEILKDQTPEGLLKKSATEYQLAWSEEEHSDTVRVRNGVLAQFLNLIQNIIPKVGIPIIVGPEEKGKIILPFEKRVEKRTGQ